MNQPCSGFDSPFSMSRREALTRFGGGLGSLALGGLLNPASASIPSPSYLTSAPKAKRVIYLFQSGGPSQMDLFDYKPKLNEEQGKELPDSLRKGQRLTGMSGNQSSLPLVGSPFQFTQHGGDRRRHYGDQVPLHRSDQSWPGCYVHADRIPDRGPPQHRIVAQLRTGVAQ